MPLRPDLPTGLNLSRRATTPVKLPKMNFPMIGGAAEGAAPPEDVPESQPTLEEETPVFMTQQAVPKAATPAPVSREPQRVIIYGRSGCAQSLDAIQDLINRQVSFTYYDVSKDQKAMAHLQAICGAGETVVPVIIQIGYGGT